MTEGQGPGTEEVGSLGEEAAKLFSALHDWAAQTGSGHGAAAGGVGPSGAAAGLRGIGEHLPTGGAECVWCPVCQVIHRLRRASPEVREHLATAASSLLQAAAAILDGHASSQPGGTDSGMQRIDLDDEAE